jgi:hypothetical protein
VNWDANLYLAIARITRFDAAAGASTNISDMLRAIGELTRNKE